MIRNLSCLLLEIHVKKTVPQGQVLWPRFVYNGSPLSSKGPNTNIELATLPVSNLYHQTSTEPSQYFVMATYLITQATGKQSQWTIRHLLDAGALIHAVVRDPTKIPSVLKRPGVTVFKGESKDMDSILQAAQGCKGVFLNTVPFPGLENLQAKTVVEACKKAGVETIVLTTTCTTGNKDMWDNTTVKEIGLHEYFSSKAANEEIVRTAGFKAYTIVRPAFIHFDYFVPNSEGNFPRLASHGILDHSYTSGAVMPHTDASDIGKYAAAALQNPEKFNGQEIELSNEYLTIEQARDILVQVSGRDVKVQKRTDAEVEDAKVNFWGQRFQLWANEIDLRRLEGQAKKVQEKFGIQFTSLEEALKRDRELLLEGIPA